MNTVDAASAPLKFVHHKSHRLFTNGDVFDAVWYLHRYAAELSAWTDGGTDPFLHFIAKGRQIGLAPHMPIDEDWYLKTYPEAAEAIQGGRCPSVFHHYLLEGSNRQHNPGPHFDEAWYLKRHPDVRDGVAQGLFASGYHHFVLHGKQECRDSRAVLKRGLGEIRIVRTEGQITAPEAGDRGLAVLAIHSPKLITETQKQLCQALRAAGYKIAVINSNDGNPDLFCASARAYADRIVVRNDFGRDFASWVIFMHMHADVACTYGHCLFINDSIIGPVVPIDRMLQAFAQSQCDVWGLSDSWHRSYHIQSSLHIVARSAWSNQRFLDFYRNYPFQNEKEDVIADGEIGLSEHAIAAGLRVGVLCPFEKLLTIWNDEHYGRTVEAALGSPLLRTAAVADLVPASAEREALRWYVETNAALRRGVPLNPQHVFWDIMIERFGYPFVKKELLVLNPTEHPGLDRLQRLTAPEYRDSILRQIKEALVATPGRGCPAFL